MNDTYTPKYQLRLIFQLVKKNKNNSIQAMSLYAKKHLKFLAMKYLKKDANRNKR